MLQLNCPECHQSLNAAFSCANDHTFSMENGVLRLLNSEFHRRLSHFEKALAKMRAKETHRRITKPEAYQELPFGAATGEDGEWKLRRYDLALIETILPKQPLQILELGAWIGWLSHRLCVMGHAVTAVDYFGDVFDGLGAKKFYPEDWAAIQMDISDLSTIENTFDAIILNRCLQFFSTPVEYVIAAARKLNPGGMLVITGLQFFKHPAKKAAQIAAAKKQFYDDHQIDLFLKPTKGFLDQNDKMQLRSIGIDLKPYSALKWANLKSKLKPDLPENFYGVFRKV